MSHEDEDEGENKLAQEDVLYISRCGIGYDGTFDSLYMFT